MYELTCCSAYGVRRKKRHYTKHTSAKLMDLAQHSPAKFWKRFRKKGRSVPVADLDKWMAHFEKLLIVPRSDDYVDSHMFDVHPVDLPSAAALNTAIHPDEVVAAITALKRNKSSDLYGMRIPYKSSLMLFLTWLVQFQLSSIMSLTQLFLPHSQLDASALSSRAEMNMIWTITVASLSVLFCLSCMLQCWSGASVVGLKIRGLGQQGKLASDVTIARQTTSSS